MVQLLNDRSKPLVTFRSVVELPIEKHAARSIHAKDIDITLTHITTQIKRLIDNAVIRAMIGGMCLGAGSLSRSHR